MARQIKVVASDSSQDCDGDVIEPSGIDLTAYQGSPVVLWNHDPGHPIATASVAVEINRLVATITFASEGASEKADEICRLSKSGIVSGISIGFLPLTSEPIKGAGRKYTSVELLEISIVALGANSNALVVQRSVHASSRPSRPPASSGDELQTLRRAAALAPTSAHAAVANRALIEFQARAASEAMQPSARELAIERVKRLERNI